MQNEHSPGKPKGHAAACRCSLCDRAERAARRAGELRQLNLEAGRRVAETATVDRHAAKVAAGQAVIDADVRFTEARRASMLDAERRAKEDKRAARFLELRRLGWKSEDIFVQVEKEFSDGDEG